jgi:peptidoglycan biosynthesis protein MviN/MurJ (putative lipid II flippase)
VAFVTLSIPLNFFLIKYFGLYGLAFSNLAAIVIYNAMRYFFLYKKFKLQPYTLNHLYFFILIILLIIGLYLMPSLQNFIVDGIVKTIVYIVVYYLVLSKINPAPELTNMFFDFLEKRNIKILKRF